MVEQGKISGLKFGDIVVNHWAGENNPNRTGVFVRRKKETIEVTNMKGKFWYPVNDRRAKLEKVGSIFNKGGLDCLKK